MRFPIFLLYLGWSVFLYLFTLVEGGIFLILNPKIFKNDLVSVFWTHSFGHSFLGMDYMARTFYPHKVSLVFLPHLRSNSHLVKYFENFDVFEFNSIIPLNRGRYDAARFHALRLIFLLVSALTYKFQLIDYFSIYKTISVARRKLVNTLDWSGYLRLLHNNIGKSPKLDGQSLERCKRAIKEYSPNFFERKIALLLLKQKGKEGNLDDAFRCSGEHSNYIPLVKVLAARGYNIVLAGETDRSLFGGLEHCFDIDKFSIDPKLLNLFFLSECQLFIGQQSGPLLIPNSCGIPCLITDALPHRLGTANPDDLVVFKQIEMLEEKSWRKLSLTEIYTRFKSLAQGDDFDKIKPRVRANSEREILDGLEETLDRIEGKLCVSTKQKEMVEKYYGLIDPSMYIYYQRNRPPLKFLEDNL